MIRDKIWGKYSKKKIKSMKHTNTHTHTQKTRKLSIVMIGMIITMIIIGFGL